MAESSLSLGWLDFKSEVGFHLGYGRTIASFSTAQEAEVELIVHAGIRRVYFPQAFPGIEPGYEWSWLRPTTTLNLGAAGTDGVISSTTSFDSATFLNWVTQGITTDDYLDISTVGAGSTEVAEYSIASVAAGAITLDNPSTRTGATVPADGTSLTFRLTRSTANYNLPDGVSRIVGDLHFAENEYRRSISVVPISRILELRAGTGLGGYPIYAGIRYKTSDQVTGSRMEILFYPTPDAYKVLTYEFEVYQGGLSDGAPFPLGGMKMSELYVESCLAVSEQRANDEIGMHTQLFQSLLADEIERDRRHNAQNYGHMGNQEANYLQGFTRGLIGSTYPITYNGGNL